MAFSQDATASDDELALQYYKSGENLYEQGRYQEAVADWERAYELSKRTKLLYNIANAYERMQDYDAALKALSSYKQYAKDGEKDLIATRLRMLEEKRASATPNPQPKPDPIVPNPEPGPVPDPKAPKGAKSGPSPAGLALVGLGVAAIGGGAGMGLASKSAGKKVEESCALIGEVRYCPADAKGSLNQHRTLGVLADVSFAVGAVAATTGVILMVTKKKSSDTSIYVTPTGVGMSGSF